MEDKVYTISSSVTSGTPVFPDCDYTCLSNYNYVKISNPNSQNANTTLNLVFLRDLSSDCSNLVNFDGLVYNLRISDMYIKIPHDFIANCPNSTLNFGKTTSAFNGVTITLSQNLVETKCDYDKIANNILLIPATMLVIYLFYCIYRMLLKGRS